MSSLGSIWQALVAQPDVVKNFGPMIVGVVVGLGNAIVTFAQRFNREHKIAKDAEQRLKRLEILEKALAVELAFGEKLPAPGMLEALKTEYLEIATTIAARREALLPALARSPRRRGWRALLLPKPLTVVGWFPTVVYYYYVLSALLWCVLFAVGNRELAEDLVDLIEMVVISLAIATPFWIWATRNWDRRYSQATSIP